MKTPPAQGPISGPSHQPGPSGPGRVPPFSDPAPGGQVIGPAGERALSDVSGDFPGEDDGHLVRLKAGSFTWTPLHSPALARLIFNHPATCHMPAAALTDLLHVAGHDVAARARDYLHAHLSSAQVREFLNVHDVEDSVPGGLWLQQNIPDQHILLDRILDVIVDEITAGPYQYLSAHQFSGALG